MYFSEVRFGISDLNIKIIRSIGLPVRRYRCYWDVTTRRAQLFQIVQSWAVCLHLDPPSYPTYVHYLFGGQSSDRFLSCGYVHRLLATWEVSRSTNFAFSPDHDYVLHSSYLTEGLIVNMALNTAKTHWLFGMCSVIPLLLSVSVKSKLSLDFEHETLKNNENYTVSLHIFASSLLTNELFFNIFCQLARCLAYFLNPCVYFPHILSLFSCI